MNMAINHQGCVQDGSPPLDKTLLEQQTTQFNDLIRSVRDHRLLISPQKGGRHDR